MTLVKWRPTRDFVNVRNEFDRLFGDFFGPSDSEYFQSKRSWSPRVDISENDDVLVISAELPGVNKDKVKVSIQDNVLFLKGEKVREKEEKGESVYRSERIFGEFKKTINLPVSVDANKIEAKFRDGVLSINLPKTEEAKIKEIPISVN